MNTGHYAARFKRSAAKSAMFLFMLPLLFGSVFPDKADAKSGGAIQDYSGNSFQVAIFEDRSADPGTEPGSWEGRTDETSRGNAQSSNGELSAAGDLLGGSALGALLFGLPYDSPGIFDILLLLLVVLVARKLIAGKKQAGGGKDLFDLPRQKPWSGRNNEDRDAERNDMTGGKPNDGKDKKPDGWFGNTRERKNNGGLPPGWQGRGSGQKRDEPDKSAWRSSANGNDQGERQNMKSQARAAWDALRSAPPRGGGNDGGRGTRPSAQPAGASGFDENEFLAGARALYVRLQTSWGARDVDDLEPFMTAPMMSVLREQAGLNPTPVQVQVLMVTAALSDVAAITQSGETKASVTFDAVIHEGPQDQGEPLNVHELWHFVRGPESGGSWRLDNIDQE